MKGLYQRAIAGELKHFSGISDPYENPEAPDIHVNSALQTEQESMDLLISKLSDLQYLPPASPVRKREKLLA